eukprot:6525082-Pyramimonas_sp.AAC.1
MHSERDEQQYLAAAGGGGAALDLDGNKTVDNSRNESFSHWIGCYEKAIGIRQELLGLAHEDTLAAVHQLAEQCERVGSYKKAIEQLNYVRHQ